MCLKPMSVKSFWTTTPVRDMTERTKKELSKRLDKMVSLYVRLRDQKCATCGKQLLIGKREAGHFVPRQVLETRWDLQNVNVQCHKCNVELGGNLAKYRQFIQTKYGLETLRRLDEALRQYKMGSAPKMTKERVIRAYNAILWLVRTEETSRHQTFLPSSWKCYNEHD